MTQNTFSLSIRTPHKASKRRAAIRKIPTDVWYVGGETNRMVNALEVHLTRKETMSWLNGLGVPAESCRPLSKNSVLAMMVNEKRLYDFLYNARVPLREIASLIYAHRLDLVMAHTSKALRTADGDRYINLTQLHDDGIASQTVDSDIVSARLPAADSVEINWSEMPSPGLWRGHYPSDNPGWGGGVFDDDDKDDDLGDDDDQTAMGFAGMDTIASKMGQDTVTVERKTLPATGKGDLADEIGMAMSKIVRDALASKSEGAVDEALVRKIVRDELKGKIPLVIDIPARDDSAGGPELVHVEYPTIFKAVAAGLNVMLIGPAGSGKTTIAEQIAHTLKIEFRFTGAIDSPYKLTGFVDAGGNVVRTAFRDAYERGGLFLFDEIDASAPSALMAFNAALANGVADFPDAMVPRHKDFYCMAAANTYGHGADRVYVGRNALDGATLDRFAVVDFDYDELLEKTLAGEGMEEWTKYVQRIRAAIFKLKLRYVVSPRATLGGARLIKAGMSRKVIEEIVVWKGMAKEARDKVSSEARV